MHAAKRPMRPGARSGAGAMLAFGTALAATSAAAQLPAPAYLSDPAWSTTAPDAQRMPGPGASSSMDRYGGGTHHAPSPGRAQYMPQYHAANAPQYGAQAPARVSPASFLSWSGKIDAQPQQVAPQAQATSNGSDMSRRSAVASAPAQASVQMSTQAIPPRPATYVPGPVPVQTAAARTEPPPVDSLAPPSSTAWRPLYPDTPPQRQSVRQASAQPTSIYDPAPAQPAHPQAPAAPVQRVASNAQGTGPHFYSLHREYGIQPDAIPLPPQFFGPTADLSTPPNDPIVKRTTTSSGASRTVAVPAPDDTSAQ